MAWKCLLLWRISISCGAFKQGKARRKKKKKKSTAASHATSCSRTPTRVHKSAGFRRCVGAAAAHTHVFSRWASFRAASPNDMFENMRSRPPCYVLGATVVVESGLRLKRRCCFHRLLLRFTFYRPHRCRRRSQKLRRSARGVLPNRVHATSSLAAPKLDRDCSQQQPFKILYFVRSIPISTSVESDCFTTLRVSIKKIH